jgi:hypothetical protein
LHAHDAHFPVKRCYLGTAMPSSFTPENWEHMDNSTRIVFCHLMARTAMKLAKTSPYGVSEAFLRLGESWSRLASEVTRASLEPPNRVPEPMPGI